MFKKIIFILLGIITALIIGFIAIGFVKPVCKTASNVTVNAPASKTFEVFNNPENMGKWMDGFIRIENVSGEKNEVGSKWELVIKEGRSELVMNETVTAFEQDKLFAFDMEDEFAKFHVEIRFEEVNGQTIISQTSTGEGKGMAARSIIAIMRGSIEKQQIGMYNKLKALVENSN